MEWWMVNGVTVLMDTGAGIMTRLTACTHWQWDSQGAEGEVDQGPGGVHLVFLSCS